GAGWLVRPEFGPLFLTLAERMCMMNSNSRRQIAWVAFGTLLAVAVLGWGVSRMRSHRSVDELIRRLADENPRVRASAAKELAKLGPEAARATEALSTTLKDEDAKVRYYSAKALSTIGPHDSLAVPALIERLRDPDPQVRYFAVKALSKIGPEAREAAPAL